MKRICYITLLALLLVACNNKQPTQPEQQNDPTNPNGLPGFSQSNSAGWTTGFYVDEFGDQTGRKFLVNYFSGKISTSQTGYVPLTVKCIIDSSKVDFSFYEYGRYSINDLSYFELNVKDPQGNIHRFSQIRFYDDKKDSIIKLLSMDGVLKASVRFSENGQGRGGNFTIEGTRHLPKLLKELNN